jgi:predicted house-cleaning NTP pyrophosphatase (Maf/HAM1 superfamily)
VHFRRLSDEEIRRYVTRDKPYDSAGGFKVEALGISLFDKVDTHDPTALVGLPLIWLAASCASTASPCRSSPQLDRRLPAIPAAAVQSP